MKKEERLGEINVSVEGYRMKIIKYDSCKNIIIEFQDKYKAKIHTSYQAFEKGGVKNPYHKSIYNIGYIGEGKYKTHKNRKQTNAYNYWIKMLMRCYDPYFINKEPTYIDCYVCDEWLCFQNFAEWFYKNYYKIEGQRMELDKDILCKGNKIYSPKTCIFVPQRINSLFVNQNRKRGKYPIGIYYHKKSNKFHSKCSILDKYNKTKTKSLGYYDTSIEAFLVYKQFKENYIKQVADEYKDIIPQKLYDVMYRYEVEIND